MKCISIKTLVLFLAIFSIMTSTTLAAASTTSTGSVNTATAPLTDAKEKTKSKPANELEFEYLIPNSFNDRHITTFNTHILKYKRTTHHTDIYQGITISRPWGQLQTDGKTYSDTNGLGLGYTYVLRKQKELSSKWALALDVSGGFLVYDKDYPATGQWYNFMWRIGPRLIYKPADSLSLSAGWTLMHVSNGLRTHNPGYNGGGITLALGWDF